MKEVAGHSAVGSRLRGNDVVVAGMTWGSMGRRDGCGNDVMVAGMT